LLVGADGAHAGRLAGRRRLIRRTDVPDRGVEPVRVGRPVVGQPVSRTVRFELGLLCKKRPTVRAEMRGTMPRWTASAANSAGVQCVTGRPDAAGGSQASARSWQICSALKAGGAPARGASFNSATISLVKVNSGGRGPDMQPSASQARVGSAAMLSSGQPRAQPPGYFRQAGLVSMWRHVTFPPRARLLPLEQA